MLAMRNSHLSVSHIVVGNINHCFYKMVTSTLKPLTREPSTDISRVQTYCYIPCLNTLTFHNPSEPLLAQESGEDASDSRNLFGGEREDEHRRRQCSPFCQGATDDDDKSCTESKKQRDTFPWERNGCLQH
jgi:hypothetical protein